MKSLIIIGILLCVTVLSLFIVFYSNHYIVLSEYEYQNARIPNAFKEFRILQVSDIHGDLPIWKLSRLIKITNEAAPDIIVITGDILDHIHYKQYKRVLEYIQNIVSHYEVYYVTGNHEYMHLECSKIIEDLRKCGVKILHNEAVELKRADGEMVLWGVDDPYAIYRGKVPKKYTTPREEFRGMIKRISVENEKFTILLSHRPEFFEDYVNKNFDLVFAGHAHGGQWHVPILGGVIAPDQGWFPKYVAGKYQKGETTMYLSRGLGNSVVPLRLFNLPELVLVVMK